MNQRRRTQVAATGLICFGAGIQLFVGLELRSVQTGIALASIILGLGLTLIWDPQGRLPI